MKKIVNNIVQFFDRRIVTPITKLVLDVTTKYDGSGKKLEKLLTKTNSLSRQHLLKT